MALAHLIPILVSLSMALMVLALGMRANWLDITMLIRKPLLLLRSVFAMNVIMTATAIIMDMVFDLHPAVKLALVALALSPVPPILPNKQMKAGGTFSETAALLATMAVLSIVVAPVGIWMISRFFQRDIDVDEGEMYPVIATGIIAPLVIGMLVNQFAPDVARRIGSPLSVFAGILLVVAFIPILIRIWPSMMSIVGNGTLLALVAFTVIGVAAGHLLGGPNPDDRTVLALATGARHPGVALAVAASTYPDEHAVVAVVVWHLIIASVVCVPYVNWRTRIHTQANAGNNNDI